MNPLAKYTGKIHRINVTAEEAKEFTSLFEDEDKYYAAIIFEEKPKLLISKFVDSSIAPYYVGVYKNPELLYNLSVADNREFFVNSAEKLDVLIDFCKRMGFEYEIDDSECSL